MSLLGRIFDGDEELGKKDDDHRPLNGALKSSGSWSARQPAPWLRRRKIFYGIGALLLLYVFVKNIPPDLGPAPQDASSRAYQQDNEGAKLPPASSLPPTNTPKRPSTPSEAEEHYHDGPIKFYRLASSLHSVARLGGQKDVNKNVVFAASNLKCASEMIPMACEMARWERSDVHFAVMGRDDMEIEEIRKLNGAGEGCDIHWHDARPDYSRWSSDFRMEVSVEASLEHIQNFIHPQVIIIDDPNKEDAFFVDSIRSKAVDIRKPIIELPSDATQNLMWLARLDSGSLAAWTTTYVDILIQAPSESSGSLVRLLKSIESADYFGIRKPHLTIELPAEIDSPTWRYLENLVWPPLDWSGAPHTSQVSLRHRIPRRPATKEEASARLVESFYPVRTTNSHVLILSPQVELSPLYYQYLIYHLLEYKYSSHVQASKDNSNLIGVSLELPSFLLNDSVPLEPPTAVKSPAAHKNGSPGQPTPFLWQAPNANAALYFGDTWMEFHSFLTARLTKPPSGRRKEISEKRPAWLEFLLELMQARGYSLLYPNFPGIESDAIATLHDELYQLPEEFSDQKPSQATSTVPPLNPDEPLAADSDMQDRKPPPNIETSLITTSLVELLPNSGDLLEPSKLPLLSYSGEQITSLDAGNAGYAFIEAFRREVGSCTPAEKTPARRERSALDLFCHLDVSYDPITGYNPFFKNGQGSHNSPVDEDVIMAENHESAKHESAAHLERQGKKDPVEWQKPKQPQQDDSVETQGEFKAQMERQARQAASAGSGEAQIEVGGLKEDETKKDESKSKPLRESLKNELPEQAQGVGDSKTAGVPEKGPGW